MGKPKSEPKLLNLNGTANGWKMEGLIIANTESLATLGSTVLRLLLPTTCRGPESTEAESEAVPVTNEKQDVPVPKRKRKRVSCR